MDLKVFGANPGNAQNNAPSVSGASNQGSKQPYGLLRNYYKDITFDTLKERHDNFSFDKVINTKAKVYDTMHF